MIRPVYNVDCDLCNKKRMCAMLPLHEHIHNVVRVYFCDECLTAGINILKEERREKGSIKIY